MNSRLKIVLIVVAPILFVATAGFWWLLTPSWSELFSYQLSDSARLEVLDSLNRQGIPYKTEGAENQIVVQEENLSSVRKYLSENNIPRVNGSGLEMFNNKDYGLSEFAQGINFQKGLEEELVRSINTLQNIKSSRVHLSLKKDSLFADRKKEPRASVVVGFHNQNDISKQLILSIQEIVASTVPDLKAENVVVVTDSGKVLSGVGKNIGSGANSDIEERYNRIVSDLLSEIVGEGNYKSAVTVKLNYKKQKTVAENYLPSDKGDGGLIVTRKISERQSENGGSLKSGVNTTAEEQFVYSKEVSEIEYPVGEIEGVSVGIALANGTDQLISDINDLIFTALGLDSQRGDKVTIIKYRPISASTMEVNAEPDVIESRSQEVVDNTVDSLFGGKFVLNKTNVVLALILLFIAGILAGHLVRRATSSSKRISEDEKQEILRELAQWIR